MRKTERPTEKRLRVKKKTFARDARCDSYQNPQRAEFEEQQYRANYELLS